MSEPLERALRDVAVPGETQARERTWALARAAFAERGEPRRHLRVRPGVVRLAVAATAAVAIAVAGAVTPPGEAVAMWIKRLVVAAPPGRPDARPGLRSLPAPGRLLVTAPGGTWIVARDGAQRRLGDWTGASWSPQGLYVVAWRGGRLAAIDPRGAIHWMLARGAPVRAARWAPDGLLIAYRSGTSLRVVYGNGIRDRAFARAAGPAAPAWDPRAAHRLAYAARDGRVHVVDALWRREAWRSAPGPAVRQLAWSAAGRRLAALGAREVRIFSARGRLLRTLRSPARMRNVALAFPPAGGGEAVLLRRTVRGARSEIVTVPGGRSLLAGPGRITDLAFAPGGGWLLAGWRDADQWVFLQRRGRRVAAVSGMVAQFSPGARRASGFPRIDGWCCSGDS